MQETGDLLTSTPPRYQSNTSEIPFVFVLSRASSQVLDLFILVDQQPTFLRNWGSLMTTMMRHFESMSARHLLAESPALLKRKQGKLLCSRIWTLTNSVKSSQVMNCWRLQPVEPCWSLWSRLHWSGNSMTGDTARAACPRFRSAEQNKRLELKNVSRREAYKNYYGYLSWPGANLSLLVGRWTSIAEAKPSEADQRKEKKSRKGKKLRTGQWQEWFELPWQLGLSLIRQR